MKGLAFLLLATTMLYACKDDTTTPASTAPSNLVYSPNSMSTDEGVAAESEAPTVDGTTPITYTLTTSPDAGADITINANSGIISATGATAGTYSVTVTATNDAGSTEFKDVFSVEVKAKTPVTFDGDIKSIITGSCAPCHVPGGGNTTYAEYDKAKSGIDFIINRTNRDQGSAGFMPQGGTKLDAASLALLAQWKADGLLEK